MKVATRWKTAEDLNRLRGTSAWTKIKFFWRKGWTEIPVIMGSMFYFFGGTALAIYAGYSCLTQDLTPKYHKRITIFRPDDPEVLKIRHTSKFDY
ncbi:uncharacterized protein LOC105426865 [Pogonomyrmex barbatus]|uniref:Uncharacterized protein LOC105426865 n=1 Tax=Pogonomyrmex barbatus TaxID=144034 RepID=A0A6I9W543_9HYME|nr:uncharacterized protein LOC105426865 [Pogonomyrmex barbatus]XP_011636568.1 uncharacterized protein LOC105426865 [Pogonomyrmex barbatus]